MFPIALRGLVALFPFFGVYDGFIYYSFEWRGIWASIVISENLPRRTGHSAEAGPGTGFEWTPGGRGWEAEAGELGRRSWEAGAGRQEAGEIRMFNHWAIGLRSGSLLEGGGVATPEVGQKKGQFWARFSRGF